MPLRLLILRSNPIAPDPRVEKTALALTNAGYRVTALGWDRTASLPSSETKHGFQIRRIGIRAPFGQGLGNFPQLLRWQVGLFRWLVSHRQEYDILHACDFDTILPALFMQRLYQKKVVYDIFDFYADHLRKTPAVVKSIIRRVDLWAIGRADAVILVDDARRAQIAGSHPRRLEVIYNSPEDVTDLPAFCQDGKRSSDQLSLAYVGLLQVERGLMEVLTVMGRHPEWKLDLAGFGGDEKLILQVARSLPNVTLHGRVPYETALQLSSSADVLFALYDPSIPNHRFSSPNKVFEAMMLGKPLIVSHRTNMDRIVKEADCGLVIEYGDETELETALKRLASQPQFREHLGRNARQAYDDTYNWEIMSRKLIRLYEMI